MQAVLLAAGASSRFWPLAEGIHKSLFVLMGKPLILWTLESLERAGVEQAVIVQGPDRAAERALSGADLDLKLAFAVQHEPNGMGDALLCAEPLLEERFVLLHPYHFDAEDLLPALLDKAETSGAPIVLGSQHTDQPEHYGVLDYDGDRATRVVEKPAKGKAPSDQRVLGVYALSKSFLEDYRAVEAHQYAFEDALSRCMARDAVRFVKFDHRTLSLKHPWDVLKAVPRMLARFVPEPAIDPSAQIDDSAIVKGRVFIGPEVKIFEHAVVKGPCYIGAGAIVGTGSLVRENSVLERQVLIGAHAEVTRSVFGAGSSTHSGFFGDSVFCPGAKAGAGTITANVRVDRKAIAAVVKGARVPTGLHSLGALVGADTALGIHTMLMPGVLIGAKCLVGPGEIVKGSVPSGSRCLSNLLRQDEAD